MGRPITYPGEELMVTSVRIRATAHAAAMDLCAERGYSLTRLVADALEMCLAERVEGYEPWTLTDTEDRQETLEAVA